jgi:hypothetical protein
MAPIVDGLEAEYGNRVAFHPAIVVLNPKGDVIWSRVGVQRREVVTSALESVLAGEND